MPLMYILIGLGAGVLGGLFGIGGATLMVPALVFLFGFTQHQAQGTTLVAMLPPIGLLAALHYYRQGNVNLPVAFLIAGGFFIGGYFGAALAGKVPDIILKKMFGFFFLFVAFKMIFSR